jgi:hypothetical protein
MLLDLTGTNACTLPKSHQDNQKAMEKVKELALVAMDWVAKV